MALLRKVDEYDEKMQIVEDADLARETQTWLENSFHCRMLLLRKG